MPKLETRDRFHIHCEVTTADAGEVIAALTKMGVRNIGFELITDVRAYKTRKQIDPTTGQPVPRIKHAEKGKDVVLRMLASGKAVTTESIKQAFKADNRNPTSVSPIIDLLMKKKLVHRVGKGEYQLSRSLAAKRTVKALPSPAMMAKANGKPNGHANV